MVKKPWSGRVQPYVRKLMTILFGCMAMAAVTARADVLIYRLVESNRTIGYDANTPGTAGGFMVMDWDTFEIRVLRATIANGTRQFTISAPQGVRLYVAKGPYNSTYTIMTRYQEKSEPFTEILDVMYGKDAVLAMRPDRLVYSPRVLKSSPKQIIVPQSEDDVIFVTSVVTASFRDADTQAANAAGQTVDGVMERYRALYLAKGFYEVADTE